MPTYQNTSSSVLIVDGVQFGPYNTTEDTVETEKILSHADLTELSETPYYNPFVGDDTVTSPGTSALSILSTCNELRIVPTDSNTVTVFINSLTNTPGFDVVESMTLKNVDRIHTLIFQGAGELNIKQLK